MTRPQHLPTDSHTFEHPPQLGEPLQDFMYPPGPSMQLEFHEERSSRSCLPLHGVNTLRLNNASFDNRHSSLPLYYFLEDATEKRRGCRATTNPSDTGSEPISQYRSSILGIVARTRQENSCAHATVFFSTMAPRKGTTASNAVFSRLQDLFYERKRRERIIAISIG